MHTLDEIAARLDRLERECRWWRRSAVSALLIVTITLLVGGAKRQEIPRTVEAEAFVLKDSAGETKAVLATWPRSHETYLRFLGERGRRLDLGMQLGSPVMTLRGNDARAGLRVDLTPTGQGQVLVGPGGGAPLLSPIIPVDPILPSDRDD